jgi:hypothetical protein
VDNQQVTALELGWLGGIIDGEGSMLLNHRGGERRNNLVPSFQVTNTDFEIVERIVYILKRMCVPHHVAMYDRQTTNRRAYKLITVSGAKRVMKLLPQIVPVLTGEKRKKAELLREYCESRLSDWHAAPFTDRQIKIYHEIRDLNARGRKGRNFRDYTPCGRSSKFRFHTTEDIVQTTTD